MIPKQRGFLAAYATCGVIAEACLISKVGRRTHYDWMADPEYAEAFAAAHQEACEALESECHQRAVVGVAEPVIYQGQLQFEPLRSKTTGQIRRDKDGKPLLSKTPLVVYKKDATLLMFRMKKLMPAYRENYKVEHTGDINLKFRGELADLLTLYRDLATESNGPDAG